MIIEARLLALGGAALRQQVLARKASGVKTEPAGIAGDPYYALLALEACGDATLATLVAADENR